MSKGPWITMAVLFAALLAVALFWPPHFSEPYKRQHANEYAAVQTIRAINAAQTSHASRKGGFTCELTSLTEVKESNLFELKNGQANGYFFSLRGCNSDPKNGKYQLVAVPQQPGVSGRLALCSDQTGAIYYDFHGSADDCLKNKKTAI